MQLDGAGHLGATEVNGSVYFLLQAAGRSSECYSRPSSVPDSETTRACPKAAVRYRQKRSHPDSLRRLSVTTVPSALIRAGTRKILCGNAAGGPTSVPRYSVGSATPLEARGRPSGIRVTQTASFDPAVKESAFPLIDFVINRAHTYLRHWGSLRLAALVACRIHVAAKLRPLRLA